MATPDQIRARGRRSLVLGTLIAALILVGVAAADQLNADADALATSPPAGNGAAANQQPGTTVEYDLSAAIDESGNATDDVFVNAGDKVDVSIVRSGDWLASLAGSPASFTFTTYDTNQAGTIRIAVPCGTSAGTARVMSAVVTAVASNGKSLSPNPITLTWTITAQGADAPSCTPVNTPPTADAGAPYSGDEGASIMLNGSASTDDDSIASYSWTVTPQSGGGNDPDAGASCSFVDGTSSTDSQPKVSCTDDGIYDVELTVEDDDGADDEDSTMLTLSNENPSASPGTPAGDVNEGDSFNLALTGSSDPGSNDTFTYQFDCGDGGGYNAASASASRPCPTNDNGSRSVKLKILDDDGGSAEYTGTVTIVNVAPTADGLEAPSPINEGSSSSLSLKSPADASSVDAASLKYSFACDGLDGSLAANYAAAGATNSASCSFADNGSFTVKGRVYDKDGGGTTYIATVVVNNVPPTVVAGFTATSVNCQTTATLTVNPDDAGVNDSPWKVNITWGDGSSEPEITRTNLSPFTVTHVYALPAAYNATVSVTDKDGDTGSDLVNGLTINQTYTIDFLPPFDDSSPSGLIVNKMKNGRVVPVKATIYDDCVKSFVTDPAANVTIKVSKTSGGGGAGDPVEEYADAGQSSAGTNAFRWSSDGFWIYNLDSKALGLVVDNAYRVDIYVGAVKATTSNWAVLQPVK